MKTVICAVAAVVLLGTQAAVAGGLKQENMYLGIGPGYNDFDPYDNALGFQFFGGYDLDYKLADQVATAVEIGYMDSGDFEATTFFGSKLTRFSRSGLWITGVGSYPITPKFNVLGRLGLDLGDEDGLMFGFGAGVKANNKVDLRFEYVVRENVNSLQANLVYFLK